jgi:threonine/homoserine/homoserine lactone efflux protein
MSGIMAPLLTGIGIGLAVAAPIGPMGVLCIQRTLEGGLVAGMATGSGAATVHLLYGTVVAFSFTLLTDVAANFVPAFKLFAALLLFWFALRVLRRTIELRSGRTMAHCLRAYRDAVVFGLANPITILLLLASTTGLTVSYTGWTAFSFSLGVFTGSMAWWLALSSAVWALRQRLNTTALRRSNQAAALALAGFGCLVLVQGVKALKASAPQAREMASTRTGSSAPHDH